MSGLRHVVDGLLFAILVFAPWFMGGRGPVGKLVLVGLIVAAVAAWCCSRYRDMDFRWRWSGAEGVMLAGVSVVLLQIAPLPIWLLEQVSPAIRQLLPLWQPGQTSVLRLGTWSTLSLTPHETRLGLSMLLAYLFWFQLLIQWLDKLEDIERLVRWLAVASLVMAGVGLAQFLVGNGSFLWIYEHPSRDTWGKVIGTFQNQNHCAHFLALGMGPLIWWLQRVSAVSSASGQFSRSAPANWRMASRHLKILLWVGLGLVLAATLLTFSRGGVIAVGLACLLTVAILSWKRQIGRRTWLAAVAIGAVLCLSVTIFGYERLATRMGTLLTGSMHNAARVRIDLWRAHWKAIPQFPLLGAGVGSHRAVYPIYMPEHHDLDFAYGENGYFQLLLETGFVGFAVFLTGFGLGLRHAVVPLLRSSADSRYASLAAALLPGLVVSLVHSWGDFVWYIPACVCMTLALLAAAVRLHALLRAGSPPAKAVLRATPELRVDGHGAIARGAVIALVAVLSTVMLRYRVGPAQAASSWDAYQRLALAQSPMLVNPSEKEIERQERMERHLGAVVAADPFHARARLTLAHLLRQRFDRQQLSTDNPLGLSQIRDAALASAFPTRAAQDEWLQLAIGANRKLLDDALRHARTALQLSPLHGAGYIELAELAFLDTPRADAKLALVQQALRVRPYDGSVQFAAGQEYALAGNLVEAFQSWRLAARLDPEMQKLIIDLLAAQMPPELFITTFTPNVSGLHLLFWHYRERGMGDAARVVAGKLGTAAHREISALSSSQAADAWHELQRIYAAVDDLHQAVACERQAVQLAPSTARYRLALATLLLQTDQSEEAVPHLEWYILRHPEDKDVRQQLASLQWNRRPASARVPSGAPGSWKQNELR